MLLHSVDGLDTVVPETPMDRHVLGMLMMYMKSDQFGFWDVQSPGINSPLNEHERHGHLTVRFSRKSQDSTERCTGFFALTRNPRGTFALQEIGADSPTTKPAPTAMPRTQKANAGHIAAATTPRHGNNPHNYTFITNSGL